MISTSRQFFCTLVLCLFLQPILHAVGGDNQGIVVDATIIPEFRAGDDNSAIAEKLEFLGGIELRSQHPEFGGISGLRFLDGCCRVLMVTDQGAWIIGDIRRAGNAPIAFDNVEIGPILSGKGKPLDGKSWSDAESLEVVGNQVFVGFERRHRVDQYSLSSPAKVPGRRVGRLLRGIESYPLESNKGLEGLVWLPNDRGGYFLGFPERLLDESGNHTGLIIRDHKLADFALTREDSFDITDAFRFPDGEILVLERYFSLLTGPYMRIRKFSIASVEPGATISGEVLLDSQWGDEVDNMEGIAATPLEDGSFRLTIVSDNNFNESQRTMLLEFRYRP